MKTEELSKKGLNPPIVYDDKKLPHENVIALRSALCPMIFNLVKAKDKNHPKRMHLECSWNSDVVLKMQLQMFCDEFLKALVEMSAKEKAEVFFAQLQLCKTELASLSHDFVPNAAEVVVIRMTEKNIEKIVDLNALPDEPKEFIGLCHKYMHTYISRLDAMVKDELHEHEIRNSVYKAGKYKWAKGDSELVELATALFAIKAVTRTDDKPVKKYPLIRDLAAMFNKNITSISSSLTYLESNRSRKKRFLEECVEMRDKELYKN